MDLSLNLKALVSQRLIPLKDTKGRAAAIEILKPASMPGSAPGISTSQTMRHSGTLKLWAMRIRLRGTESTPLNV